MNEDKRTRTVESFVNSMKPVEKDEIKLRQIDHLYKADPDFGTRVAEGLGLQVPEEVK